VKNIKNMLKTLCVIVVVAGCGETALGPQPDAVQTARPAQGSTRALSRTDTLVSTLVIDPSVTSTYALGDGNTLTIPAHSLCDPATSTYGPTEWDKPCPLATSTVTVTFKGWLNRYNHPHVDFSPSMRFLTPPNGGGGWVSLNFADASAWSDSSTKILYCATATSCVDESATDFDVRTQKNGDVVVWRKIKHFSGYNVATGEACEPSPDDPDCIDDHSSLSTTNLNLLGTVTTGVLRTTPLAQNISQSAVIGTGGGTISIPAAGITVTFPAGALAASANITVTALQGQLVAYEFAPHGITFAKGVRVEQSLSGTNAVLGLLAVYKAGYFLDTSDLDETKGTGIVQELLSVNVGLGKAVFNVWHFSGYMLCTGASDE
jgi:hypothetical protein